MRTIESRIWSIERRHFQWPWTTHTRSFKVTPFFDAEYLRNGTKYRYCYNEILILTNAHTLQCDFEWAWVTLLDLTNIQWHAASRGLSATAELLAESVLMLLTEKLSKLVHTCRNYSLPKLARFLRHSVELFGEYFCALAISRKCLLFRKKPKFHPRQRVQLQHRQIRWWPVLSAVTK